VKRTRKANTSGFRRRLGVERLHLGTAAIAIRRHAGRIVASEEQKRRREERREGVRWEEFNSRQPPP
jgi:hypothetical protein